MDSQSVNLTLSAHRAELLRTMRDRRPDLSAAEIVEEALEEQVVREAGRVALTRSPKEIRAWLDRLASLSDKIPARPG